MIQTLQATESHARTLDEFLVQSYQSPDVLPQTLEEFVVWEPNDGFKYEWNDGEIICSAAPVLPEFEIRVDELLTLPKV